MRVDLLVSIEDLPNCFFFWHLKLILRITQSIDNTNKLTLLCQFPYKVLLIFPPRNGQGVSFEFKMQISSMRYVKLFLPLGIDKSPGLSSLLVEPTCDISSCYLNQWLHFRFYSILLYKLGEIIHIIKEGYPYIVRRIVCLQFRENVIPPFMIGLRNQLFKLICCTLF